MTLIFLLQRLLECEKRKHFEMKVKFCHLPIPAQEATRKLKITNVLVSHDKFLEIIVSVKHSK